MGVSQRSHPMCMCMWNAFTNTRLLALMVTQCLYQVDQNLEAGDTLSGVVGMSMCVPSSTMMRLQMP